MSIIYAPWNRPLEGNHIVNVPPDKQKSWPPGRQFLMAGIDPHMGGQPGIANSWWLLESDFGPTAGATVETAKFKNGTKATGNNGADFPVGQVLYGVVGTNEEGWTYDPSKRQWWKEDKLGNAPEQGGTVALPPGPEGYSPGEATAEASIEFTVTDDGEGFWTAKTPETSAAAGKGNDNPHKGVSIINPGQWEKVAGGMSVKEALDLDDYKAMGWTGLDKQFLAWQGPGVQPAGEELASTMDEAMKGDKGALRALRSVGVKPPKNTDDGGGAGLFGSLGFRF